MSILQKLEQKIKKGSDIEEIDIEKLFSDVILPIIENKELYLKKPQTELLKNSFLIFGAQQEYKTLFANIHKRVVLAMIFRNKNHISNLKTKIEGVDFLKNIQKQLP